MLHKGISCPPEDHNVTVHPDGTQDENVLACTVSRRRFKLRNPLDEKMWRMAFAGNRKCMLMDCSCVGSTYFRDAKRVTRGSKHGQRRFAETFRGDLGDGADGVCP